MPSCQPEAVEPEIRRILGREARLAWKARLEAAQPALLLDRAQIEGKVRALAGADAEMRSLNKRALIDGIDAKRLGSRQQWHDISRLQGPQMLSLRQFVERAADIGLFEVRPVWLMNPDVASRLLPLRPGMFDVVVYDEASQMPVEMRAAHAAPGKAVIVSGDEKQLPPTSFFATRVENDEDDSFDDDDERPGAARGRPGELEPARDQGLHRPAGARPVGAAVYHARGALPLAVPRAHRLLQRRLLCQPLQVPVRTPTERSCRRSPSRWSASTGSTQRRPTATRRTGW